VELQRAAADRPRQQRRDKQQAVRRPELGRIGGDAASRIEAARESAIQLGDVLPQAMPCVRMGRIDGPDLHHRDGE
jgi:hypothetical protein